VNRDIIVVGSGVIGCAVAYELARRGASVGVVAERPVAMGATQASAGVLAPYIEAAEGNPLLDLTVRSLDLFDEFIARLVTDSGMTVPYRRTGTLDIAIDETEMHRLRATADLLARRGVPARLLDAESARGEEPQLRNDIAGGLLIDTHGFVAATDFTRALIVAARRYGAQLLDQCRVRRIARAAAEIIVETDRGALNANGVVLAAGSWAGGIDVEGVTPRVPVRPVRGQLLHLAWSGPALRRATWSRSCYLVPWDDGTVLVGATIEEVGFDERSTVEGVRGLLEAACGLVPHARAAGFRAARAGLRPASSDGLPVIGVSTTVPNLSYATGHFRNGILLAPLTAQLVADVLLDGRIDPLLGLVSPARFGL
jgi:glycine oxidase